MQGKALTSLGILAALAACAPTPGADYIISQPEAVQIAAHEACFQQQGIAAPFVPNVLRLNDGRVVVSAVNGNGVSLAQARAVNQCAQNRLLGGGVVAPVGAGTYVAPAPVPALAPSTGSGVYVVPTVTGTGTYVAPIRRGVGCVEGRGALQAGTEICVGYTG